MRALLLSAILLAACGGESGTAYGPDWWAYPADKGCRETLRDVANNGTLCWGHLRAECLDGTVVDRSYSCKTETLECMLIDGAQQEIVPYAVSPCDCAVPSECL